jgi:hypothetical protein
VPAERTRVVNRMQDSHEVTIARTYISGHLRRVGVQTFAEAE